MKWPHEFKAHRDIKHDIVSWADWVRGQKLADESTNVFDLLETDDSNTNPELSLDTSELKCFCKGASVADFLNPSKDNESAVYRSASALHDAESGTEGSEHYKLLTASRLFSALKEASTLAYAEIALGVWANIILTRR